MINRYTWKGALNRWINRSVYSAMHSDTRMNESVPCRKRPDCCPPFKHTPANPLPVQYYLYRECGVRTCIFSGDETFIFPIFESMGMNFQETYDDIS